MATIIKSDEREFQENPNKIDNYRKSILIYIIFLLLSSCNLKSDKQFNEQSSYVNINFEDIQNTHLTTGKIVKKVKFIPLETSKECAVSTISKLDFYNDTLFILSNDNLFIFTFEGKFIRRFANKGRGPEEYSVAFDFSIDKQNDQVIIYDNIQNKICIYDLDGNFIKNIPIGRSWQIEPAKENILLCYPMNIFGNQPNSLIAIDENGDTLKEFKNELTFELKGNPFMMPVNGAFYQANGSTCFKQFLSDTLYAFDSENLNLIPRYIFEEANSLPLELLGNFNQFNNESKNYSWLSRVLETDKHLFLTLHSHGKDEKVVYFKDQKKLFPADSDSGNKIQNKPLNLSSFYWPRFKLSENTVIKDWSAIYFKEYFENVMSDEESLAAFTEYDVEDFAQLYQSVNINDNPIIQITTLK